MDSDRECFFRHLPKCLNKVKQTYRTLSQNSRSKIQDNLQKKDHVTFFDTYVYRFFLCHTSGLKICENSCCAVCSLKRKRKKEKILYLTPSSKSTLVFLLFRINAKCKQTAEC